MVKVELESGFACEIDESYQDDIELLELLIELDKGSLVVLPEVAERVLGEENKKALYDHLRDEKGRVATSEVRKAMLEVFRSAKNLKN